MSPASRRRRLAASGRAAESLILASFFLMALGCGEEGQIPTGPGAGPELAAASAALTFTMVTTGEQHSCGLTGPGKAYCWGLNNFGQLGDNTVASRTKPVPVTGGLTFTTVNAGENFTCGITAASTAYCWGFNDIGQLGDGTLHERHKPTAVLGGLLFRQIRPGAHHTCGITTSNKGYCWGSNENGRLGIGTDHGRRSFPVAVVGGLAFRRISAGGGHTCGFTTSGKAYCWGSDNVGQVGDGQTALARPRPTAVAGGLTFTQLSTGIAHSCGVASDKKAYCWGDNLDGQLGIGNTSSMRLVPTLVQGGLFWNGVSTLQQRTCGVSSDQRAYCWGIFAVDPQTIVTRSPAPVPGDLHFSSIGGGLANLHACGVGTDAKTYCWGLNDWGQLGDGTLSAHWTPMPVVGP